MAALFTLSCSQQLSSGENEAPARTVEQLAVESQSPALLGNQLGCPSGAPKLAILATTGAQGSSDPNNSVEVLQGGRVVFSGDTSKFRSNTSEVNLNGVDATNTYLGNWSFPSAIDGGYYVYYQSTNGSRHLGVGQ